MKLNALKPGDIIDVVAPASRCDLGELRKAVRKLEALGFKPRVPKNIFAGTGLFANTDSQRLKQLRRAVYAKDSSLIWCVRGGYGSLRLLEDMAGWRKPEQAKMFLGYSDVTTLHSFFQSQWGWPTLHGPMLDRFGRGAMHAREEKTLWRILGGETKDVTFEGLKALNGHSSKDIRGRVVGGNMAVLQSGLLTASELKPKGAILFFEDIGERPHRVDRMLTQFEQAGWFKQARAVVFGHFLLNDPKDRRQLWSDVIARFARAQKIPVLKGLAVGHDPKVQMPLPLNTPARLTGRTLTVATGIS